MSDERQSPRAEYKPKGQQRQLAIPPPVGSENERQGLFSWRVLLVIALVALILTIVFGYFALGPSDMMNR
jgi:H+/Cl- antiporter ClcA